MMDPLTLCLFMFLVSLGLLLVGFPVAFTLAGSAMSFAFIGYFLGIFDITFLAAFPQRIFSTMTNEVLVAVPLFIFMGVMLERSKIAEELLDNMGRLFGPLPGGIAYSVCIVGALLAASTGIVGATVVTMGLLSLPTMIRRGYNIPLACGSIAASGTLGQIIPPSIVLVILGDQLSIAYQNAQFEQGIFAPDTISVNDLFAGALFPGLILVGMYLLYQIGFAILRPNEVPAIPRDEPGEGSRTQIIWHLVGAMATPLILIVTVLGSILGGVASPTEAAGVGAVGAVMLAGYRANVAKGKPIIYAALSLGGLLIISQFFDLRVQRNVIETQDLAAIIVGVILSVILILGLLLAVIRTYHQSTTDCESVLVAVMQTTTMITSLVFVILIGAAMFSLVFRGFGGDVWIEGFLNELPGGVLTSMIVVMGVMFLMGFFLDFLEIVFIVVPIVSPILLQMEMPNGDLMSPVWLGVMMAINLQTSFLTPPFGFALFYLRGVAPEIVKTTDIYKGVIPFVLIQLIALLVLSVFPGIATWLPVALYGK